MIARPRICGALVLALVLAGCGNVERTRPAFFRTNRILESNLHDLPDDGLVDYAEPDGAGAVVGRYIKDRFLDLSDILGLSVLGGYGISVNARATKIVQVGGGWYQAGRAGFVGRYAGAWWENRWEGGVSLAYAHGYSVEGGSGTITSHPAWDRWVEVGRSEGSGLSVIDFLGQNDRDFFDIGATAFAGVVGLDVEIRTAELGDFLLGFTTVDFREDDTIASERRRMVDLALHMLARRPAEFEEFLEKIDDADREGFLEHPSGSVKAVALRSLRTVEDRRPKYAISWYARFLDQDRSDLLEAAIRGLRRVTGKDFGYDPDRRREDNQRAVEAWKEYLRANP